MPRRSAGLILYRRGGDAGDLEVFLIHLGGPLWRRRDLGSWTIPTGDYGDEDEPLSVALRSWTESTGFAPPSGPFLPLEPLRQPGGKWIEAWACLGDCDPAQLKSDTYIMQWPPGSGQWRTYPEVEQGGWFRLPEARQKMLKGQLPLLENFLRHLLHDAA